MVKINHERWSLRLRDNLERERRRGDRPEPSWFNPAQVKRLGISMTQTAAEPGYVTSFNKLPRRQQGIIDSAFLSFAHYLEKQTELISLIIGGSAKRRKVARQERDLAYEKAIVDGAVFMDEAIVNHREPLGLWRWYSEFHESLSRDDKNLWSDFNEMLSEESLPFLVAEYFGETPEMTEKWRGILRGDA